MTAPHTAYHNIASPLGAITLCANDQGLLGVWLARQTSLPADLGQPQANHPIIVWASAELADYFAGHFAGSDRSFSVPLVALGTPFQLQVWQALRTIPYGQTWSYQDLAEAIGRPTAARAVGMANGKNPLSIVVPCHRVIGKNGRLTGYAGGLERKAWLLEHETHTGSAERTD
ncbi:methylated-DNA--[protein]-cysteine S-methyltransferase [Reinekea sp.]|jgi:methylated-DNA-[protein]-cysteine S-methyltransferase|uniref:methylated-DNA--[protein]-cysteine S-methyltransferase n=1 Tax=Reinekea sp. TaxID=1970455 RepID=UPI002A812BB7|nr:methylated-DNA--[protein]-cysteine S-methyltransferase [Reinekea sp.]